MSFNKIAEEVAFSMNQIMESPEHKKIFGNGKIAIAEEIEKVCCHCDHCGDDCPCKGKCGDDCKGCPDNKNKTAKQLIQHLLKSSEMLDKLGLTKASFASLNLIEYTLKMLKKAEMDQNDIKPYDIYNPESKVLELTGDPAKEGLSEHLEGKFKGELEDEDLDKILMETAEEPGPSPFDPTGEKMKARKSRQEQELDELLKGYEESPSTTRIRAPEFKFEEEEEIPDLPEYDVPISEEPYHGLESSEFPPFSKEEDGGAFERYKRYIEKGEAGARDIHPKLRDEMAVASRQLDSWIKKHAKDEEDMDVNDVMYADDKDEEEDEDWEDE